MFHDPKETLRTEYDSGSGSRLLSREPNYATPTRCRLDGEAPGEDVAPCLGGWRQPFDEAKGH